MGTAFAKVRQGEMTKAPIDPPELRLELQDRRFDLQELRRRIYRKAKSAKTHRFWGRAPRRSQQDRGPMIVAVLEQVEGRRPIRRYAPALLARQSLGCMAAGIPESPCQAYQANTAEALGLESLDRHRHQGLGRLALPSYFGNRPWRRSRIAK